MKIGSVSSVNYRQNYNLNNSNNTQKANQTSFEGLTPAADLSMILSEQALFYKIPNAYSQKAEALYRLCQEKASIVVSNMGRGVKNFALSIPEISKEYQACLGSCKSGDELKWFMNFTTESFNKGKALVEDIVLEKRVGVLIKAINNDEIYDTLMKSHNPSNDKSIYNVVKNMDERELIDIFFYNPKGNDLQVMRTRAELVKRLDKMSEIDPKFKDTRLRQTIIQTALAKL